MGQVGEPNMEGSIVPTRAKGLGYGHQRLVGLFSFALFHWACAQQPETTSMKLSHSVVSK